MIKVLLVDDHELVRTGLQSLLVGAPDIEVVGTAVSGEDALKLAAENIPDVVLMDLKMPGIGGLEATRNLIALNEKIRVIAVTACDEDPFPSRLLQAGASGYLTKGCEPEEMFLAIRKVHNGQRYISPNIAQQLALKHVSDTHDDASPFDLLSERELQVMMLIIKGFKVQEISQQFKLSPKTVNTYRYRLFEKLKISSDVELTHLALRYNMLDENQK